VFVLAVDLDMLTTHEIRFRGPVLDRRSRGALSAAGISVMKRRSVESWDGQLQEYLVRVDARDPGDAMRRTREALEGRGSFESFVAGRGAAG